MALENGDFVFGNTSGPYAGYSNGPERTLQGLSDATGVQTTCCAVGPTTRKRDPYWNNVVLLGHFDGTNGSTSFPDSSLKNRSITNMVGQSSATVSTTDSKFGGASMNIAANQFMEVFGTQSDFDVGASDFTVEMWFKITATTGSPQTIFCHGVLATANNCLTIYSDSAGTNIQCDLRYNGATGIDYLATGAASAALNTWHHVAVSRVGTNAYIFLNGTLKQTTAVAAHSYNTSTNTYIGHIATNQPFRGNIDELRFTKGVGRYSANFTLQTAQFPSGTDADVINGYAAYGHNAGAYLDIYDTGTWVRQTMTYTSAYGTINGMAFSPDGNFLALAHTATPFISIYKTTDWTKISGPATLPPGTAYSVAWSPDGTKLAVGHSTPGFMTVYKTDDWTVVTIAGTAPTAIPYGIQFSPDGTKLALGLFAAPWVRIYNASDFSNAASEPSLTSAGQVNSIDWSPDGGKLAFGCSSTPFLRVFNTSDWSAITAPTLGGNTLSVSFTSNTEIVAAMSVHPRMTIWNITANTTKNLSFIGNAVNAVAARKYTPKTISGTIVDSNGNPVARSIRAYRRDTGMLVSEVISSALNGSYSIGVNTTGEHDIVLLDDIVGTLENDQILRTFPV